MHLPDRKVLDWILKVRDDDELIGKDALTWRKRAQKDGIDLPPELGGLGRGIQKLKQKTKSQINFLATSEMAEMATQWHVAEHRFSQLKELTNSLEHITIPACGAGSDALILAEMTTHHTHRFYISDISPLATWFCKENLKLSNAQLKHYTACADATKLPHAPSEQSYTFLDPARRQKGQRLNDQYLPNLEECFELLEKSRYAQIKLSPGASILNLSEQRPNWSWEVIQLGSEVKEITGSYGFNQPQIKATHLDHNGIVLSSYKNDLKEIQFNPLSQIDLHQYCVIPEPCLKQSQTITNWSLENNLSPTNYENLFYTPENKRVPLSKTYAIIEDMPIKTSQLKKVLKKHNPLLIFRSLGVKPDSKHQQVMSPYLKPTSNNQEELTLVFAKSQKQTRAFLLKKL